jgi:hypothetical protein
VALEDIRPGAYLHDEEHLFEVKRLRQLPGPFAATARVRVLLEDCKTFQAWEFTPQQIRKEMRLVRPAPCAPANPETLTSNKGDLL